MDTVPSYLEDDISQIPALHALVSLGYRYLSPAQSLAARGGRLSGILLEDVLRQQLARINKIEYRGRDYAFSEANLSAAIVALRELPVQNGYVAANKAAYDLVTLGKSFEQVVEGDRKSFSLRYVDWENADNNIFHVAEEVSVLRANRDDDLRPDLVLYVNGIPMVIIECKSPRQKDPIGEAVRQHGRNQEESGIRSLYYYSNLLLALTGNDARYATTYTKDEFWAVWKETGTSAEQAAFAQSVHSLMNRPMPPEAEQGIFARRSPMAYNTYMARHSEGVLVSEQDRALASLCRPGRLLDLIYNFILYDDGVKKIARYQQYFTIRQTLDRVSQVGPDGRRAGGVIWHTQGSGKSLTMVMLAQLLAKHKAIQNPKIVLVTDRVDLDDQITETFRKCHRGVVQATTGASAAIVDKLSGKLQPPVDPRRRPARDISLLALLHEPSDDVITTVINKFESALRYSVSAFESPDIFVLVDEAHRTQYGGFHASMRRVFPNACLLAFTGTPLLKQQKSTARQFGGLIEPVYSIRDAVTDKAVVPLFYEGRHHVIDVNERPIDTFFDKITESVTDYGKATIKRKYSTKSIVNAADQVIYARAWDIVEHFIQNFQGTGLKGQLVTAKKADAIRYKQYIDEIGETDPKKRVSCEVIMSPPDTREGDEEDNDYDAGVRVRRFWSRMMERFNNNPETYEKVLIEGFKRRETPELIIVVDKLLTGFDAPCNAVLYLTRQLKDHTLLQAIARVNRLFPGKDYGLIVDYWGNLGNLDSALNTYAEAGLANYEAEELAGTLVNIREEVAKLPQAHSEVWDIFRTIANKNDPEAYEELLFDNELRYRFYEKLSLFARLLKLALSSIEFLEQTPDKQIDQYKRDAKRFLELRASVKHRYFDTLDFAAYEVQVQKLIDKHISTEGDGFAITERLDLFDTEQREAEAAKTKGKAAKADHIASKTIKAIEVRINEDPVYYKKLAQLLRETIETYHQQRLSEAEYLKKITELEAEFQGNRRDTIPVALQTSPIATAYFSVIQALAEQALTGRIDAVEHATALALGIDGLFRAEVMESGTPKVDWQSNTDVDGRLRILLGDYLYDYGQSNGLALSWDQADQIVEECLKIARLRYQ